MVEHIPPEELGPRFARALSMVREEMNKPSLPDQNVARLLPDHPKDKPFCISFAFSDSIILISHDESSSSALALLVFALRAMQSLIALSFPVRAAVAFGNMFTDLQSAVFLGRPLIRAYDLEKCQDWIGGVLDDTVNEVLPQLSEPEAEGNLLDALFPRYTVPLKAGAVRPYRTFNWRWNLVVEDGTRSLFRDTSEWKDRRKVSNTLEYARWIRAASLAYPMDPESVPVEVRTFFVGKGPPPPKYVHGDDL